jgi:hypothetical protein
VGKAVNSTGSLYAKSRSSRSVSTCTTSSNPVVGAFALASTWKSTRGEWISSKGSVGKGSLPMSCAGSQAEHAHGEQAFEKAQDNIVDQDEACRTAALCKPPCNRSTTSANFPALPAWIDADDLRWWIVRGRRASPSWRNVDWLAVLHCQRSVESERVHSQAIPFSERLSRSFMSDRCTLFPWWAVPFCV